jgi:hypothetical protein
MVEIASLVIHYANANHMYIRNTEPVQRFVSEYTKISNEIHSIVPFCGRTTQVQNTHVHIHIYIHISCGRVTRARQGRACFSRPSNKT